jgi:hypothetical protein
MIPGWHSFAIGTGQVGGSTLRPPAWGVELPLNFHPLACGRLAHCPVRFRTRS